MNERKQAEFAELFKLFSPKIYNLLYRMLRNREDAQEITQEVFVRAYKSRDAFRGEAKPSSWLYRIAVNLALNQIRKKKLESLLSLDFLEHPPDRHRYDKMVFPDEAEKGPAQTLLRKEAEAIVQHAIDSLPAKQRIALILNRYEERSYEEVAEIMGVSLSSVESRLHRAKRRLAQSLLSLKTGK